MINIQCFYYVWIYGFDGVLIGVLFLCEIMGDFDKCCKFGFLFVVLLNWNGFIFVSFDLQQMLLEQFVDVLDVFRFLLDKLCMVLCVEYDVVVNWKLFCENYFECYYCVFVYLELYWIMYYQSGGDQEDGDCFVGGLMKLNEGFNMMSFSGMMNWFLIFGFVEEDYDFVYYYVFYLNFWLSLYCDYVFVYCFELLSVECICIECFWFVYLMVIDFLGFVIDDVVQFWDFMNC